VAFEGNRCLGYGDAAWFGATVSRRANNSPPRPKYLDRIEVFDDLECMDEEFAIEDD
jgi:hypothetical protein